MKKITLLSFLWIAITTTQCQQAPKTTSSSDIEPTGSKSMVPSSAVPTPEVSTSNDTPEKFFVLVKTTQGDFHMTVNRAWSPKGVDRFYELMRAGFYKDVAMFRVISGFVAQFGISGDPATQKKWETKITDDPVIQSNQRGYVSFATAGPNTRTTQIFINYADNSRLDRMGFSPFAKVDEAGMKVVDRIFKTSSKTPGAKNLEIDQQKIETQGNSYLRKNYPTLDYIKSMQIVD